MLKLTRRKGSKGGTWTITGTIAGRRYSESTRTNSKPHAEAILAKRQAEILDRVVWGEERTLTFAEAVTVYLNGGGSPRYLTPLTAKFGPMRLADITDVAVSMWASVAYPGASTQTLNRQVYTPLIAVYRRARADGGPAPHFTRPRGKRRRLIRWASDAEIALILSKASPSITASILMMTFSGARASECARLTGRDIDWSAATATLRMTKNGDPRVVALPTIVLEALQGQRLDDDEPVCGFSSRFGIYQALQRAARRVGLKYSPHEIGRHSFAARLLRQGRTLKEVQEAGGWKDYRIVAETYGHLERKQVDEAVRASATDLQQMLGGDKKVVIIQSLKTA